jgi:Ca2+/Na+ antiporter
MKLLVMIIALPITVMLDVLITEFFIGYNNLLTSFFVDLLLILNTCYLIYPITQKHDKETEEIDKIEFMKLTFNFLIFYFILHFLVYVFS